MPADDRSQGTNIMVRGIRLTAKGNLDDGKIVSTHLENLNRLPDTAEEIETIARVLGADPKQDVFLREDRGELCPPSVLGAVCSGRGWKREHEMIIRLNIL
ncbi:MAG: hypothetical protein WCH07_01940 [Deltaproteobacteria bacterium]